MVNKVCYLHAPMLQTPPGLRAFARFARAFAFALCIRGLAFALRPLAKLLSKDVRCASIIQKGLQNMCI